MAEAIILTTLIAALYHPLVQAAFCAWYKSKGYDGTPEKALSRMTESLWRAFTRSPQALALGFQLPRFDASTKGKQVQVQAPDPVPSTTAPAKPGFSKPCLDCGTAIPCFQGAANTCATCHATNLAEAAKPQDKPQIPAPTPVPAPSTTHQDPLMVLLAQRLKDAGLVADPAPDPAPQVTLDDVEALIKKRTTQAIQAILDEGILVRRQEIRILVNGSETATVTGKAPKWFGRLVKLAQCRINALLVGPAGCGKTTGVAMLAETLQLPFYRVSLSAGVDEGVLQGWLLPVEQGGQFTYVPSTVVKAYEEGGVVLLDELDAADANMLIILSAVLDEGQWAIPMRHNQPTLKRHADFVVVGAANTWGHGASRKFVGAQQLDERTLSRFRMGQIACDYDADLEADLYEASVVEMGQRLRTRCRAIPEFGRDVSTRDIESAHTKLKAFNPDEVWYEYFADWSTDELERVHVLVDHDAGQALCA